MDWNQKAPLRRFWMNTGEKAALYADMRIPITLSLTEFISVTKAIHLCEKWPFTKGSLLFTETENESKW